MCFIIQANSFSWQLYRYYRLRSQSHHCPTVRSSGSLADHERGIHKMLECGLSVPKSRQEELMPCSTPHTLTGGSEPPRQDHCSQPTSLCFLLPCHQTFPLRPTLQHSFKSQLKILQIYIFSQYLTAVCSRKPAAPCLSELRTPTVRSTEGYLGYPNYFSWLEFHPPSPTCLTGIETVRYP